jgi:hypothetical protein
MQNVGYGKLSQKSRSHDAGSSTFTTLLQPDTSLSFKKEIILEENLAVERSLLLRQPLIQFVSPDSAKTFRLHLGTVFSTGKKETCELIPIQERLLTSKPIGRNAAFSFLG